jgi:alpha-galactosidase
MDGAAVSIVFAAGPVGAPRLVYLGPLLPPDEDLQTLSTVTAAGRHGSQADAPQPHGLFPEAGRGGMGRPALSLRCGGSAVTTNFGAATITSASDKILVQMQDAGNGLAVAIEWQIGAGDLVRACVTLTNTGTALVAVDNLASLVLPLPRWASHATHFSGRWAGEMQMTTAAIEGARGSTSRGGRPGFGGGNWLLVHAAAAATDTGHMVGLHLGWNGDHDQLIERDADGSACVHMGCRLDFDEIRLAPGDSFRTPDAFFAFGGTGRNGVRAAFHAHLRADVLPSRAGWGVRKVHLNSWEALGFEIDEQKVIALVAAAAALGVERFVLDDGWFNGRRDDTTSLGDWTPDSDRFPDGLAAVVDCCAAHGLDFGLWVEPEMVNLESALYRAHPDWCLHIPLGPRRTQRHQLVLDLTRAEVADHVFSTLDALLNAHPIAYLKWDHNRELFPLNGKGHAQALALLAVLDRLRAAHPRIEIESCASGGGRIDFATLARCQRVWVSDNTDPIERLRINAAWSQFLPPEIIGSHVGPSPNPITGRNTAMDFRAKVAFLGHMGVEADPATMRAKERAVLAAHIALYKQWRDILHTGVQREIDFRAPGLFGAMVVSVDGSRAVALAARCDFAADYLAEPVRLNGLDQLASYRVTLLEPWPDCAGRRLPNAELWRSGVRVSGRALAETGLMLPLDLPETAWLIALAREPG